MSESSAVGAAAPLPLSEHLQHVTEQLAGTSRQEAVFQIVLEHALEALNAVAGAVLLVKVDRLELAATRGHEEHAQTIWQNDPLDDDVPAGAALKQRQPFFYEHQGALIQAFPELKERTGAVAPVATAVLPIFLDNQPLGAIIIDFQEPHTFTADEQRFLQTLAAQCAVALGRSQTMRDLEARIAQVTRDGAAAEQNAELLASLGDTLQTAQTPDQVAIFTLSKLAPILQAQSMLVVFLEGEQLRPPVFWGDTPQSIVDHMSRPGLRLQEAPLLHRASQEHHGLYLENYHREPGMVTTLPSLAVGVEPISLPGGHLSGFLVAWRPVIPGNWQHAEHELMRRAAVTLGLALERAQQAQVLREQHAELALRTRTLEGFSLLSRDFALEHDPSQLVGRAQELILSLLPAGMSTYYRLEDDVWQLRSHRGVFRDLVLLQKLQAGLPRGKVLNIERPYESRQPYYQEQFDPTTTQIARDEFTAVQTTAALPILIGDQVYGVLVFGFYQPRSWSMSERAMVETAARSLGIALERSMTVMRLLEQRDALDARSQELQAANEELEAFTYSASHDLRTPVRHVMGFAELAEKAMAKGQYDKVGRSLDVVKQGALRMTSLIDGMLILSRSGRQLLQLEPVDLNALAALARQDVAEEFGSHPVRWQVAELPTVQGDVNLLQQVLTNLLSNAVKYSAKREQSEVSVWCEESASEWTIRVKDNGVGFDPDYAHKLFGIFQRLHTEGEFKGTGVGLATVKRIVQKHGGRVLAESDGEHGATFGFTLPN